MSIVVTGATGFIGRALVPALIASGERVRVIGRTPPDGAEAGSLDYRACDLETADSAKLSEVIGEARTILHLAGYAHAMREADAARHQRLNRDATIRLAEAARALGARLVFLSSVKAISPEPGDAYGVAKAEAEAAIREILGEAGVILRPSLVVGPGASGNLARLLRLAALPLPLPFALARAPRSMIAREDVVALVIRAMNDPAFRGGSFTLSDPDALSLRSTLAALRRGLGRKPGLFPLPVGPIACALRALGKGEEAKRLFSAAVYPPTALQALGWQPVLPVRQALQAMAAAHLRG